MSARITYAGLALKGLRFYWRTQVSVFLGAATAAAVLVGGLLVGDCVTYSLRQFALMRLGQTHAAMQAHGRFVDAAVADRLQAEVQTPVVPALVVRGIVLVDSPAKEPVQVNHVQVVGVDRSFWRLTPDAEYELNPDVAAVNGKLAARLGVGEGAELAVRVGKPSLMPRDAPLASRNETLTRRGRFTLRHIIPDDHLGRFSLAANQVAPDNVFVDLNWLQEVLELPGRANVLLVGEIPEETTDASLAAALKAAWKLEDVGIQLTPKEGLVQLESDRIFLDPATAAAAAAKAADTTAVGVLTYLVNSISHGGKTTPYSFAVAAEPSANRTLSPVPAGMKDDEVLINRWVADKLGAAAGDEIAVAYYAIAPDGAFVERTRRFRVHRVVSMQELARERELMPVFPGLTDVEQCTDWDIGMPLDKEMLADKDNEQYWEDYRATPKLVVTLAAGREMWGNRFGNTSAVRFAGSADALPELKSALENRIDPAALGLFLLPVREQALRAIAEAMSFGELFISLSSFLIISALMLTGMLFVFGIQQRAEEMGLLLGIGYRPGQVRRIFLWEGCVVALLGSILGALLGMAYTRLMVWGLAQHWSDVVANAAIRYHVEPMSLVAGGLGSFICAVLAMLLAMWRQTRRPARELLTGDFAGARRGTAKGGGRAALAFSVVCGGLAAATVVLALTGSEENHVYTFFAAGLFLLLSTLGGTRFILRRLETATSRRLTVVGLGVRNTSRRGGRSLTAIALLACGCFMVFAISAMQQDLAAIANERWSGTGGFALFAESTLPLPDPLETKKGRKQFGLDRDDVFDDTTFVSIKVRDGDDASCFNLNRAQSPRLLGVEPQAFIERKAFMDRNADSSTPWSLLQTELPEGVIPGLVGDGNTALWNMQKKVGPEDGDEIVYKDERGTMFRVRLVGKLPMPLSVFQGTILIARRDFIERYPSEAGYRMFLADVPAAGEPAAVQQAMARRFDRVGLDVNTTLDRLLEFHGVETTYLAMFLVLGGLGLVLGALGLGIVVLRNVLERRAELALLRCVGFSRRQVLWLVLAEHWLLLVLGLLCGLISAFVAIYPSLTAPGMQVPGATIALLLGGIMLAGFGSTALAAGLAMRGELIPSLRQE